MQQIFSKRDQRKIQIIDYLIDYQQTTIKELAEECKLPMKTVWSDIQEINKVIHPISIDTDQNGIYLHIPPAYSIRYIYIQLLHYSNEITVLEYAFFNAGVSLEDLADQVGLSSATLRRMITYINKGLKSYDITISTNPVTVGGNYRNVIKFIIYLLSEKYVYEEEYLSSTQVNALNQLLGSSVIVETQFQNYPDYKKLRLWIYVRTVYYKNHMHELENRIVNPFIYEVFDFENDYRIYDEFERVFKVKLEPQSIMFIFEVFINNEYVFSYNQFSMVSDKKETYMSKVNKITNILNHLANIYEITLDNKEALIVDVYNTLRFGYMKPFIIYDKRKTFIRELTHYHLLFYQTSKKLIKEEFKDELTEEGINEIIYILITHWQNLTEKLEERFHPLTISILMDTDIENTKMITGILKQRMVYKIKEFIPSSLTLSMIVKELPDIDILITNIPGLDDLDCRVVCIQDYPTATDLIHILESEEYVIRKNMIQQ